MISGEVLPEFIATFRGIADTLHCKVDEYTAAAGWFMPMNQSVYRVKLHLSLSRGFLMSICSSTVYETPAAVAPRRAWRPKRRALMWATLILIAMGMAASYLLPQDLRDTGAIYSVAACVSFVGRVLRFHLAIATGVIALIGLLLRSWRMTLCALPLSIVLLM